MTMLKDRALEQEKTLGFLQERTERLDQVEDKAREGQERAEASRKDAEVSMV